MPAGGEKVSPPGGGSLACRLGETLHFFLHLRKEVEKEKRDQGGLKASPLGNPLALRQKIAFSVIEQSLLLRPRHPAYAPALLRW